MKSTKKYFIMFENESRSIETEETEDLWNSLNSICSRAFDIKVFEKNGISYSQNPLMHIQRPVDEKNKGLISIKNKFKNIMIVKFNHIGKGNIIDEISINKKFSDKNSIKKNKIMEYSLYVSIISLIPSIIFPNAITQSFMMLCFLFFIFQYYKERLNYEIKLNELNNYFYIKNKYEEVINDVYKEYLEKNGKKVSEDIFYVNNDLKILNNNFIIVSTLGVDIYSDYEYYIVYKK